MIDSLGYKNNLFILPFDHRSSFIKLFGFENSNLSLEERETISHAKEIIYNAFKRAVEQEIPKEQAAILVDEEYGDKIIQDAISNNYNVILTTEKSGQKEFSFEYAYKFAQHIEKYKPAFVKALVRYRQNMDCTKLKLLSDYCHQTGYKFLFEILTENKTENEAIMAIKEFQNAGVEPDIWKLEGMETERQYLDIVSQAQAGNRQDVKVVILGRGEKKESVEKWIKVGATVKGIAGFAVGRTIFQQPLFEYKNGKISHEKTAEIICDNFLHFYHIFIGKANL
jgi:myo-inositol catabolism protein IolC